MLIVRDKLKSTKNHVQPNTWMLHWAHKKGDSLIDQKLAVIPLPILIISTSDQTSFKYVVLKSI